MATIVTRSGKGSPLTHAEVDANFTNLNTDKLELSGGTMTGNLSFGDNDKAIFGAGSDLQIYHDGLHSYIDEAGTGDIYVSVLDDIIFRTYGTNELVARFNTNQSTGGWARLYHRGSEKLETTSTGVDITGTLTSDGLTVDGVETPTLTLTDLSTSNQLKAKADNTGGWFGTFTDDPLRLYTNNTQRVRVENNGDISFYEDTGTTAKFFWDASAESLGIGTSSPSVNLHIKGNDGLIIEDDGTTNFFRIQTSNSGDAVFYTGSGGTPAERMRITSTGNVGIGTSSPSLNLSYDRVLHIHSPLGSLVKLTDNTSGSGVSDGTDLLHYGSDTYLVNREAGNTIFGTSGSERMRIDSSGQVGIGTSSPSSLIHAVAPTGATAIIEAANGYNSRVRISSNVESFLEFGDSADSDVGEIVYNHSSNYMRFNTNASERMRIDSSGNLLVGGTSAYGTSTFTADSGGQIKASASTRAAIFNRHDSDGTIVEFRKADSTVGSIGVVSSRMAIGSGGVGLFFDNISSDAIEPHSMSTNSVRDAAINIGASGSRFKDLYLSGGVYLGGTGSANKLDDYESGTWTPALKIGGSTTGITYNAQEGVYIKVGQQVFVNFRLSLTNKGSSTGTAVVTGLPFSVADSFTGISFEYGGVWDNWNDLAVATTPRWYLNQPDGDIVLLNEHTTAGDTSWDDRFSQADITDTTDIRISFTYKST